MTLAESRVRRAWVGFSALAFAICGVLLLVQFSAKVNSADKSAPSPAPGPESRPAPPPPTASERQPAPELPPPTSEPAKPRIPSRSGSEPSLTDAPSTVGGLSGSVPPTKKKPPAAKRPQGHGAPPMARLDDDGPAYGKGPSQLRAPGSIGSARAPGKDPGAPGQRTAITKRDDGAGAASPGAEGESEPVRPVAAAESAPKTPELSEGVLKVNVPPSMIVGQSDHVRAVVGKKIHVAQVDQEAALETNDGARVQIGRDLMISSLVRMELRGDSAGDFDILALAPDATQHISDNDATVWEWAVTPKQEGMRGLTLIVSDLKEGSRELMRSKIYPVHIDVRVTAWQRVRELTVAGSTMLSGLAGLIGAWLGLLRPLLQRRTPPGGEGGGGAASRGQGAGSSAGPGVGHAAGPGAGQVAAPVAARPAAAPLTSAAPAAAPVAAAHPAPAPTSHLAAETANDAMSLDVAAAAAPPVAAVMPAAATGPVSGPVPAKPAAS